MVEINFYFSVCKSCFASLAESFSNAINAPVTIQNNSLIFPPSFAEGRFSYYELNEGVAMILMDGIFHQRVKLNRKAIIGNDNYKILYSINDTPVVINNKLQNNKERSVSYFSQAILFTSHTSASTLIIPCNQQIKLFFIIFHRNWGLHHLLHEGQPGPVNEIEQFIGGGPLFFTTGIDIRSVDIINALFNDIQSGIIIPAMLEGYIYQLLAIFVNNRIVEGIRAGYTVNSDAIRIIKLKESLEKNLDSPMPSMDEAAALCLMSRTKFIGMFKSLFKKNYSSFFLDLKMAKAKELLEAGLPISRVTDKTGYKNTSHFIKVFKRYFNLTPGAYQEYL